MKRQLAVIVLIVSFFLVALVTGTVVYADDNDYLRARAWQRHEEGIRGLLSCFMKDCVPTEYGEHMREVVSAELSLHSYGISPTDPRLVIHLADDMKSVSDLYVYVYRIFKKRLHNLSGFTPTPQGSFDRETFRIISRKDSSQRFAVDFQ